MQYYFVENYLSVSPFCLYLWLSVFLSVFASLSVSVSVFLCLSVCLSVVWQRVNKQKYIYNLLSQMIQLYKCNDSTCVFGLAWF